MYLDGKMLQTFVWYPSGCGFASIPCKIFCEWVNKQSLRRGHLQAAPIRTFLILNCRLRWFSIELLLHWSELLFPARYAWYAWYAWYARYAPLLVHAAARHQAAIDGRVGYRYRYYCADLIISLRGALSTWFVNCVNIAKAVWPSKLPALFLLQGGIKVNSNCLFFCCV